MSEKGIFQPLNPQDEYFLDTDTPTAPTHIGGLEIYSPPRGAGRGYLQKLFARWKSSPVRTEPFNFVLSLSADASDAERGSGGARQAAGSGRKGKGSRPVRVWRKLETVNVEEHVYLHALPKPGGQRELGELVARLHVNRLDRHRPLWEMHLIEGLEGGRYAVYTKLHHSQFDGKRGAELIPHTRSRKASERGLPPLWSVVQPTKATTKDSDRPAKPGKPAAFAQLSSIGKALRAMGASRAGETGSGVVPPYSAPASILNGPLTARRRLGTQSLSIPRMRALGAAVEGGATVNEILLALCGGAFRRYLRELDALPEAPLIAACPVAVPRGDDASAGNAVGQMLVSLGTHIAAPRKRLLAVVESGRANKGLMKDLGLETHWAYTQLSMMPQILAAKTRFGHKVLNANLVISNVPGLREAQYVNGARLEAMYSASMLLAGQALNITVSSIGDSLDVGIMACPDLVRSPQKIAVYLGTELDTLCQAMGTEPKRRAPWRH